VTQPTQTTENAIQAAGAAIAPRVTPDDLKASIVSEHFFTAADGDYKAMENAAFVNGSLNGEQIRSIPEPLHLLTFCVLVLKNGFTVTGESACASPENFNAEIGRRIARENAVAKIWPLLGYELRTKLAAQPTSYQDRVRAEYDELNTKLSKLVAFFATDTFEALPKEEKDCLTAQHAAMCDYSNCLSERIQAFGQ